MLRHPRPVEVAVLLAVGLTVAACGRSVVREASPALSGRAFPAASAGRSAPTPRANSSLRPASTASRAPTAPTAPPVTAGTSLQGRFVAQLPDALAGYQYVNRTRNDCAQAAVATARTMVGDWVAPPDGPDRQVQLQAEAPPDVAGGVWGSSPRLVQQMLGSTRTVAGFEGLSVALRKSLPVVVLLDLGPLGRGSGAHWTVVTGLSVDNVQVTNLGGGLVDRAAFARAWRGLVPSIAGMASRGLLTADTG